MIEKEKVTELRNKLESCGFSILSETDITKNVAKGLELDTERREALIQKKIPSLLKNLFKKLFREKLRSNIRLRIKGQCNSL